MQERRLFSRETIATVVAGTAITFFGGSVFLMKCSDSGIHPVKIENVPANERNRTLGPAGEGSCKTIYMHKTDHPGAFEDSAPEIVWVKVCSRLLDVVDVQSNDFDH